VDRGYGIAATSTVVDEVAERHEELLTFILTEAPKEIRVRRLAAELRRTSRKVNTLEHSVIPRLRDSVRRISMALDEQEREERHRLQMLEADH
jgi:V/A-type H+-transporting ATPase subunit D